MSTVWAFAIAAAAVTTLATPASAQPPACGELPLTTGSVIDVVPSQAAGLQSILDAARPGDTIRLEDGVYPIPQTLVFRTPHVTLRSRSGRRADVVLDGRYTARNLVLIQRSGVAIADLTLTRSYWHLVHVVPDRGRLTGTLLHNLRGVDGGEQFIKVNPSGGHTADDGTIRCSSLELTDEGRAHIRNNCYTGGIDIHQAQGWQIIANLIQGFWCSSGLSEHAIHAWTGSRDTLIDRNVVVNSARGIGLGLGASVAGRTYDDRPCGGATAIGHFGGAITNNFVAASDPRLFSSSAGFDVGIGLEQSCQTRVLHNTVISTAPPRSSSIEWRFANTAATIANNLVSHTLLERNGGRAVLGGNVERAPLSAFVDVASGDLHLTPAATFAIDRAVPLAEALTTDIDVETRGASADVGADEYSTPRPPGMR